jgi:hypothetical protein
MIILDTNVVSEAMRVGPSEPVMEWLDSHPEDTVWLTAVTDGEILIGIALLPVGRRRLHLERLFATIIDARFADRTLPYDRTAAAHFPGIMVARRRLGRPTSIQDAQIAAIALAHGATLATRNVKDFDGTGVALVNPWEAPGTT